MADRTPIEWTDATWNVINGCSVVSPGCTNCYAMRLAGTRFRNHPTRLGLTTDSKAGPVWNGQVRFNEKVLTDPLRWTRPRRIFGGAHGDLFHENVPDEWIDRVFAVMALAPRHVFQILTKRPERMRAYLAAVQERHGIARALRTFHLAGEPATREDRFIPWPLPNIWLGVSAEDQARAEERIPVLLDTPAAVRWLSAEPLLGPIDLTALSLPATWPRCDCNPAEHRPTADALNSTIYCEGCCEGPEPMTFGPLDWVVAGGESGPGARPMHPDWARQLRDQCAGADVPFLFKQWGDWGPTTNYFSKVQEASGSGPANIAWPDGSIGWGCADDHGGPGRALAHVGKKAAGRILDGHIHDGFPGAQA